MSEATKSSTVSIKKDWWIQFQNASRLFDLERQRRANRCAEEGQCI